MSAQNTFSFIRLLIAFVSMSISLNAQGQITVISVGVAIEGNDAVIYFDDKGKMFTQDYYHPYFDKYVLEDSPENHIKNMEGEVTRLKKSNEALKKYINDEKYINTSDKGALETNRLMRYQKCRQELNIIQYQNTINVLKKHPL